MNKKQKYIIYIIVAIGLFVISASVYLVGSNRDVPDTQQENSESIKENEMPAEGPTTKEEAIEEAENYQTDEMCIMVITEAVHQETGAEYTFPTGCMPPGWEPVDTNHAD